ncbi:MAG: PAS domain S-box protein [Coleofasciculaceae cyanobacterium SM2_1_6]|nr:PAS domain S-box protein [Coleofasciculaceae cyanobacterium SM2_1_6]
MNLLFTKMLQARGSEYLTLNQQGQIISVSPGAARFGDIPEQVVVGEDITRGFPELLGLEDVLIAICAGDLPDFSLTAIARISADQVALYFDIYLFADPEVKQPVDQLICLLEDVTERRALEQSLVQNSNETNLLVNQLRISKNYIDQILASMADVLIVTNPLGQIKTVNQAAIDLFGYTEAELINQSIFLLVKDAQIIKGKPSKCQTKTNKMLVISFSCSTLETMSEVEPNLIYVGRNITELQRQQQRQELQYAIAEILTTTNTLNQAIPKVLAAICHNLEWDLGALWMPEVTTDEQLEIKLVNTWCKENSAQDHQTQCSEIGISYSQRLVEEVWVSGCPDWVIDIENDPRFFFKSFVDQSHLQSAFSIPIIGSAVDDDLIRETYELEVDDEFIYSKQVTLGVMVFFSYKIHPLDVDQLKIMGAIGYQIGQYINRKQAELALHNQQEKTNKLLLNILPVSIAARLKEDETTIAETFDDVTILFADLVGFTQLSAEISATALVELLNQVFSEFDRLTEFYKLEKIKTIGDCYMVVGGLPQRREDHALAIANIALDMLGVINNFNARHPHRPLSLRIGINTGTVIAGVIGLRKFIYDLWGDTVNTASRMESQGLPDKIQVTEATYAHLHEHYHLSKRGTVAIKGKGEMVTYFLEAKKS